MQHFQFNPELRTAKDNKHVGIKRLNLQLNPSSKEPIIRQRLTTENEYSVEILCFSRQSPPFWSFRRNRTICRGQSKYAVEGVKRKEKLSKAVTPLKVTKSPVLIKPSHCQGGRRGHLCQGVKKRSSREVSGYKKGGQRPPMAARGAPENNPDFLSGHRREWSYQPYKKKLI